MKFRICSVYDRSHMIKLDDHIPYHIWSLTLIYEQVSNVHI